MKVTLKLLALGAFFIATLLFTSCDDELGTVKPKKEFNNGDEIEDPDRMD